MKIYRVIYESHDIDEAVKTINVNTFFNKENAKRYFKESKEIIEKQSQEFDLEDYTIEESEECYEIYRSHRYMEQGISLWLEEDKTRDEIEKELDAEKENEYEM